MRRLAVVLLFLLPACGVSSLGGDDGGADAGLEGLSRGDGGAPDDLAAWWHAPDLAEAPDLARRALPDLAMTPPGPDLAVPPRPKRRVFLLETLSGDLGGKTGADKLCTDAAATGYTVDPQDTSKHYPIGGTFVAVLWYGTQAPADYLQLGGEDVVNLDGSFVARDEDFLDSTHQGSIDCRATDGVCKLKVSVWTGYPGSKNCDGWTAAPQAGSLVGSLGDTIRTADWRDGSSETNCTDPGLYVYCLEQ